MSASPDTRALREFLEFGAGTGENGLRSLAIDPALDRLESCGVTPLQSGPHILPVHYQVPFTRHMILLSI